MSVNEVNAMNANPIEAGIAIPTPAELDNDVLKEYISTWRQGSGEVQTFSATGLQHIAQSLGISIVENTFKECTNGGFYFTAKAENLHTGQTYIAHVWQSDKMRRSGKEVFDPDSIAKGSTRVTRNAIAGLVPVEFLKRRVLAAIQKGEIEKSALHAAQQRARDAMRETRENLMSTFGHSPSEAFELAQVHLGPAEDWDTQDYNDFTEALHNMKTEWFLKN